MPATEVGPRDLGDIALYWRAHGRRDLAEAFARDPRRGRGRRDGLLLRNTDRDNSMNFRPVLLAGLGDWPGLVDWVRRYEREGWQLREWNSPTYTGRVLTALVVGAALADRRADRLALSRAVREWCDLLALLAVPARPGVRTGEYGGERVRTRVRNLHVCPTGMRANRWTALCSGATDLLGLLIGWPHARRHAAAKARRQERRHPMPTDPRSHRKPISGRELAAVLALGGQHLSGPVRDRLRRVVRGEERAVRQCATRLVESPIRAWGGLRVRVQRRERLVVAAVDRATSWQKGAVTAARLDPRGIEIQAVSPLRRVSRAPGVKWDSRGCEAVCQVSGRRSLVPWLDERVVDLRIDAAGVHWVAS